MKFGRFSTLKNLVAVLNYKILEIWNIYFVIRDFLANVINPFSRSKKTIKWKFVPYQIFKFWFQFFQIWVLIFSNVDFHFSNFQFSKYPFLEYVTWWLKSGLVYVFNFKIKIHGNSWKKKAESISAPNWSIANFPFSVKLKPKKKRKGEKTGVFKFQGTFIVTVFKC